MSGQYSAVLRSCDGPSVNAVVTLLGRAFSLKEATCANIVQSAPIILIDGLEAKEAAAVSLVLRALEVAGAQMEYIPQDSEDLPKIDWPKKPALFKQKIPSLIASYELPLTAGGNNFNLIDLLLERIGGGAAAGTAAPAPAAAAAPVAESTESNRLSSVKEFTGLNLPEVTPFSNVALSDPEASSSTMPAANTTDDVGARMNELFGEDDEELVPSSGQITNILDKLLPDEEPGTGHISHNSLATPMTTAPAGAPPPPPAATPQGRVGVSANGSETSGANQIISSGTGNFSLFLSKITDAGRRDKAVPIIAELAHIEKEEAEKLAKKVIIPVLRSVSQDEAEAAKHRFAEIGVLARIKNG